MDKIGVGGSLFAALCCLGFPALVSILSAFGLGFLINDDILRPMMIVFLLLAIFGLTLGMRHHGSPWALIVGFLSAMTLYVFIYVSFNELIAGFGIAGLVACKPVECVSTTATAEEPNQNDPKSNNQEL